jgi:hypothetical protein
LLERSSANPALLGDLIEEYGRGRTQVWYWKQVMYILVRERFSSKIRAFRWVAALPSAMVAALATQRLVFFFAWRSTSVSSVRPFGERFMIWGYVALFLVPAAFVSAGVWAAPSRKDAVARVAWGVIAFWAVFAGAASVFFGQPFSAGQLAAGACVLLGGMTGVYPREVIDALQRARQQRKIAFDELLVHLPDLITDHHDQIPARP